MYKDYISFHENDEIVKDLKAFIYLKLKKKKLEHWKNANRYLSSIVYQFGYIITSVKLCKGLSTKMTTITTLKRATHRSKLWGCPHGVMVKAMDSGIVVSEFILQSRYYVHIRANTLGKGMNPHILPVMG